MLAKDLSFTCCERAMNFNLNLRLTSQTVHKICFEAASTNNFIYVCGMHTIKPDSNLNC